MSKFYAPLFLFAIYLFSGQTRAQAPVFEQLTTNHGLSQNHVGAIIMDKQGFMWFGSEDGLNRYDGYSFKHYKHDPSDSLTLDDSYIQDIYQDYKGTMWVGTSQGLNRFVRKTGHFQRLSRHLKNLGVNDIFEDRQGRLWLGTNRGLWLFDVKTQTWINFLRKNRKGLQISQLSILCLTQDLQGKLWIGTETGLYRFDPLTKQYAAYRADKSGGIKSNWIRTLYCDRSGKIWIGTRGGGLSSHRPGSGSFTTFLHDPKNPSSISHNDILSIVSNRDGRLWVGTENGGVSVLNTALESFQTFKHSDQNNSSISDNSVYSIYRDVTDNLWLGTFAGGVNFLPRFGKKFITYQSNTQSESPLSNNLVLSICEGPDSGKIWLGTDGGGLNVMDRKTKKFSVLRHSDKNLNSPSNDYIVSVCRVSADVLGLAYHMGGFDLFDTKKQTFKHHRHSDADPASLASDDINNIFTDKDGGIWLGTWKAGLDFYDPKTGSVTHYRHHSADQSTLSGDIVTKVFQDRKGRIWIGTYDGLNLLNPDKKTFTRYQSQDQVKNSISSNKVLTIQQADGENLWIGTLGGGLNYFERKKNKFTVYDEKQGFPSGVVHGIMQDKKGELWVSTNNGIVQFNPVSGVCRTFGLADGIVSSEFKSNSFFHAADGEMFFGGVKGLTSFYPDKLVDNRYVAPVYLTEFLLFNKPVPVGGKGSVLTAEVSQATEIHLNYDQSVLSFRFSALNYTMPRKNQYAYQLVGFDKDWVYSGLSRRASYTNLDPGNYELRVKASNNDGVWNTEGNRIRLRILPPMWQTFWFRFVAVLLLVGCIYSLYRIRMRVVSRQKQLLEDQIAERTRQVMQQKKELRLKSEHLVELNKKLQIQNQQEQQARQLADQANKAKGIFLATMSHEIRTPMNAVIGMAGLLSQTEQTAEQAEYTEIITSSGESLLAVINDILDFSKIEAGSMELENISFDLCECIEGVLDLFSAKAAALGLDLLYEPDEGIPHQIIGDGQRLRQILINLVGNAIKFTTQGEILIHLKAEVANDFDGLILHFTVQDTGIGIPEDKLDRLFMAFSQVDSSHSRKYGGTGLGLIITERLVKLMGGSIRVKSSVGQGSCFDFFIKTKPGDPIAVLSTDDRYLKDKKVLVVEDNASNQRILAARLTQWGILPVIVSSAQHALVLLETNARFDLLIADQHMPQVNGIELCREVKQFYPSLPICLLSSVGDTDVKSHKELFSFILHKPLKTRQLYQVLQDQFSQKPAGVKVLHTETGNDLSVLFWETYPLKVLVAEDNPVNEKLFLSILRKLGYGASVARNGLEALHHVQQEAFDVVFMDVQMPELDGLEATRQIRAMALSQPFIAAMTANAMQEDKEDCMRAGMDYYLSKPVRVHQIKEALKIAYLKKMAID